MRLHRPVRTRFRCGFPTRVNLATQRKLAGSFFKRHAVTSHEDSLRRIVGTRFQVLFHSPSGVLFTFPSRYLSAIGHLGVLSLGGWSPQFRTAFHGCGPTQEHHREAGAFHVRDGCPLWCAVPRASATQRLSYSRQLSQQLGRRPTTPNTQRLTACTRSVWALPLSLATTRGVSVD